jgi:uncharacterized protein YjbI with pentapeptide repeats
VKRYSRRPDAPEIPDRARLSKTSTYCPAEEEQNLLLLIDSVMSPNLQTSHVRVSESVFSNCQFPDATLSYFVTMDVIFETCDFANSVWKFFTGSRVRFVDCRFLGLKANEAEIVEGNWITSVMQFSQFRFSKIKGAWFEGCNLQGADFSGSDLTGATFADCDLTGASFSEANCNGVDFRSSIIDGLVVGASEMKGAVIGHAQAADVVTRFGVTVLGPHEDLPAGL